MKFLKKVKENLKDPKKKSLTLLGIYAIFFIFVFIVLRGSNSSTANYIPEEINDVVTNYEYLYKINNNDNILEVSGTYKNNEDMFNYNGLNYTKKENIIYLNDTPIDNLGFDIDRYKYNNIELLIENSDSKTTYKDSNKVIYNMNVNEYFTLLNETNNCSNIDCSVIDVSVMVISEDYITNIVIDLSNYYGYKYNIEINYNNINSIE